MTTSTSEHPYWGRANDPYFCSLYEQVDAERFAEWKRIVLGHGGREVEANDELAEFMASARVCNAADRGLGAGDQVLFNRWNRIDCFASGGQFYVGIES